MAISSEHKKYLSESLKGTGFFSRTRDGAQSYFKDGGIPVAPEEITAIESIISAFDPLPTVKAHKIAELKTEGLARIQAVYPAIKDWDDLELVRDQWLSTAPAARQATAEFQSMIDIFQAGKAAVTAINALTTITDVEAYDVVNTPSWL